MEEKDQYFDDLPQQRSLRESEVIKVYDKEDYLCRITLDVDFQLTPSEMMGIFSNPDNTGVFRDIYAVPFRKVVEDDGAGRQKIMVEQVSGFKFLVVPITFSTHLNVEKNLTKFNFRSLNAANTDTRIALKVLAGQEGHHEEIRRGMEFVSHNFPQGPRQGYRD